MISIAANLRSIRQTIQDSAAIVNRDANEIQLLAVSKTKPMDDVLAAYHAEQRHFGENYVQEGYNKTVALADYTDIIWHFIGPIQSNKTRLVAESFHWVHTISRDKIAQRLNDQRPTDMPPLNICIQINIEQESSKSGVVEEQVYALANRVNGMPNLILRGIMAIPSQQADANQRKRVLQSIADIYHELKQRFTTVDTLSLGMSGDMSDAIAAGSTMVRVGTAIFGERPKKGTD